MDKKQNGYNGLPMTRRQVLKVGALGSAGLLLPLGMGSKLALAETGALRKFVDQLPLPTTFDASSGSIAVAMKQIKQQVHSDIGPITNVWGYGNDATGYSTPGPSFDVWKGDGINVTWHNMLASDPTAPHFLEIDQSVLDALHGATDNRKAVVHLHGGKYLTQLADGFPEDTLLPGESVEYFYPNAQDAANLWYHDHSIGNTRLNVMMGLAGFYLVRDANEASLNLPSGQYEIPLAIQDRRIKDNGQLGYDRLFDDTFFGDVPVLNGVAYPFMFAERRKYRFRLLNGSNTRSYTLHIGNSRDTAESGVMVQIGTDSGLMDAPLPIERITLTPGERADVIIDFSKFAVGDDPVLYNSRPSRPMEKKDEYPIAELMQFKVTGLASTDTPVIPANLRPLSGPAFAITESEAVRTRSFKLEDYPDPISGDSKWLIDRTGFHEDVEAFEAGHDPEVTVNDGDVEIWEWVNKSSMVHPMHIHIVDFQVLSRQRKGDDGYVNVGVDASEAGPKDTVRVGPKEKVRVLVKFNGASGVTADELFPFHCHILEHEDHDMMRAFKLSRA